MQNRLTHISLLFAPSMNYLPMCFQHKNNHILSDADLEDIYVNVNHKAEREYAFHRSNGHT
jgi:hypothetical protein